jgi:hypothetical protein
MTQAQAQHLLNRSLVARYYLSLRDHFLFFFWFSLPNSLHLILSYSLSLSLVSRLISLYIIPPPRTLSSNYVCDCSCQMSDTSLKEHQGKVRLFQFSGPCNPFPLPVRVRKQQRLRTKFLLLREAHLIWEETHDRALTRLGGPVYLVNKGIGTHPLVAHLYFTPEQQGEEDEGEEMEP